MPIEIEEKWDKISVKAKGGSAIIEDRGRKITVIGVWSGSELKELVDTIEKVRKRHLLVERED